MKIPALFLTFVSVFASSAMSQETPDANCPTVVVNGPSGNVGGGERATYVAKVDGKSLPTFLEYVWSASDGKIVSGQGTSQVEVMVPGGGGITVTVEVKGFPTGCNNRASESSFGDPRPQAVKLYEFVGAVTKTRAKLAAQATEIAKNDRNARLTIFLYGGEGRNSAKFVKDKTNTLLKYYVPICGYDAGRITIVHIPRTNDRVSIWLVPAGADSPTP